MKRRAINAYEQDVFHARQWYVYLQRAGATRAAKRASNKRIRRGDRREISEQL